MKEEFKGGKTEPVLQKGVDSEEEELEEPNSLETETR